MIFSDRIGSLWSCVVSKLARAAIGFFLLLTPGLVTMAQTLQTPNIAAQRTAMKKLDFWPVSGQGKLLQHAAPE